jgi:hypothetical protein
MGKEGSGLMKQRTLNPEPLLFKLWNQLVTMPSSS